MNIGDKVHFRPDHNSMARRNGTIAAINGEDVDVVSGDRPFTVNASVVEKGYFPGLPGDAMPLPEAPSFE